jgi:hypothetical protein
VDDDLDIMSREELIDEVKKLRDGIRIHRDSTGQELCWHHPASGACYRKKPTRNPPCPRGRSS